MKDLEERRVNVQFAFYDCPFCRYIKSQKLFCLQVLQRTFNATSVFTPFQDVIFFRFRLLFKKRIPLHVDCV